MAERAKHGTLTRQEARGAGVADTARTRYGAPMSIGVAIIVAVILLAVTIGITTAAFAHQR